MALVTCDTPSAFRGYQWLSAGSVVEMPDEEAAELLDLAGPNGGYVIVPEKKPAARKVTEPAPPAKLSEVVRPAKITEA